MTLYIITRKACTFQNRERACRKKTVLRCSFPTGSFKSMLYSLSLIILFFYFLPNIFQIGIDTRTRYPQFLHHNIHCTMKTEYANLLQLANNLDFILPIEVMNGFANLENRATQGNRYKFFG